MMSWGLTWSAPNTVPTTWSVDEATDQDCLIGSLSFSSKERSGDLSCGVGPLFNIHCQWKEVGSFSYVASGCCRRQNDGVSDTSLNGSIGEMG
jgi:hypothetical protein